MSQKIIPAQMQSEWWDEIGRVTLAAAADVLSVTSLPARAYLKVLVHAIQGGVIDAWIQFNNDTATNYAHTGFYGSASYLSATSQTANAINPSASAQDKTIELEIMNIATSYKLLNGLVTEAGSGGPTTAPAFGSFAGKWANSSNQINRIDILNRGAGDFAIGSQMIILGHD